MRSLLAPVLCALAIAATAACSEDVPASAPASSTAAAPQAAATAPAAPQRLRVEGTRFVRADGTAFDWRGITSFRLVEMEAAGRGAHVDAYLAWAARNQLNVVRVLTMAKHLFELTPERGLAHLDAVLARAARHGLYVEVVALADTEDHKIDPAARVKAVAEICARHANAIVEIANEPYHPTQSAQVRDKAFLRSLVPLVPDPLLVAAGAGDYPDVESTGDFITVHFPRGIGWRHVRDLYDGREMLRLHRKPVVNDEPIGAGEEFQPGRRDDSPERFRAVALASRMLGMGATFHYEGGLHSVIPSGRQLESFNAWQEAWTLLPAGERLTAVEPGEPGSPVTAIKGQFLRTFVAMGERRAWVLAIEARGPISVTWAPGWKAGETKQWPESALHVADRSR
jgi:hypothetical protein